QVHDPAAPHMLTAAAAVRQDLSVSATGVFQGIGQDRQAVEGTLVVDGLADLLYGAVVPGQNGSRRRRQRTEGIAECITKQSSLGGELATRPTEGSLGIAGGIQ